MVYFIIDLKSTVSYNLIIIPIMNKIKIDFKSIKYYIFKLSTEQYSSPVLCSTGQCT